MEPTGVDVDELIEFWTLLDEDRSLLAGRRGATALGFALLLKHYSRYGRFPCGRSEVPDEVVAFVARQLGVAVGDLGFYEWSGSTIEYHRAQIRDHLGYRVTTVADQERLTGWLWLGFGPVPVVHRCVQAKGRRLPCHSWRYPKAPGCAFAR